MFVLKVITVGTYTILSMIKSKNKKINYLYAFVERNSPLY